MPYPVLTPSTALRARLASPVVLAVVLALVVTLGFAGAIAPAFGATDPCGAATRAVASPTRPAADLVRDPLRKPVDVLCFFDIAEGSHVLDLFSGSGYYTEIVSHLVGAGGDVVAHNNAAYLSFQKDQITERYKDGRLANVRELHAEANELSLAPGTFDAVLLILAWHDVYYISEDGSWPTIDGPKLLAEIMKGLKPGGMVGVVDHTAETGSPSSTGTTLHRIDPARLRRDFETAGFVFDGESDALRNPDDDRTKPMYDETIRGKTDRIIYRFRKAQ